MSNPFRIVVLASTRGTDLQAIIDEIEAGKMPNVELVAVVSNKEDCMALARARAHRIPAIFVDPRAQIADPRAGNTQTAESLPREAYDQRLLEAIKPLNPDLIVLVGYMRILTPLFVREFPRRIINVHPALMPKFSGPSFFGSNVHESVLAAGEKETGMTIHYVDDGVDTGPIILQKTVKIDATDTPETLKAKVQELEKIWYPEVIRQLAQQNAKQNSD